MTHARSLSDRALAADPDNVDALIGSARADIAEGVNIMVTDPMAAFAAAEAKLTKALSSVPDHASGHLWLGLVEILTKRASEGHRQMRTCVGAGSKSRRGSCLYRMGQDVYRSR